MATVKGILTWPKRRWRGGGYGIHSPFAFDLIYNVLHPKERHNKYATEADAAIDKNYRFIARCLRYFQPSRISVQNNEISGAKLNSIISSAGYKKEPTAISMFQPAYITIIDGSDESLQEPDPDSNVIIFCNLRKSGQKKLWKKLRATGIHGADFSDLRRGIICRFKHLPRQSYKIVIR